MELIRNRDVYTTTPTELLKELGGIAGENQTRSKARPQTTRGLKNALTRLASSFRRIGIYIQHGKSGDRFYTITKFPQGGKKAPKASEAPKPATEAGSSRTHSNDEKDTKRPNAQQSAQASGEASKNNQAKTDAWTDWTLRTDKNLTSGNDSAAIEVEI
jgi:hypothetical protein